MPQRSRRPGKNGEGKKQGVQTGGKRSPSGRGQRRPGGRRPAPPGKRPVPKKKSLPSGTKRPSTGGKPPAKQPERERNKKPAALTRHRKYRGTHRLKSSKRRPRQYLLVVNRLAGRDPELSLRLGRRLERRLKRRGDICELHESKTWQEFVQTTTQVAKRRPFAVVVFGGDGSVRLAASRVARAKGLLGIVPCGRFNNIFRSLYGHTDQDKALDLIRSNYQRRIDAGLANGTFFMGSLITGLVPAMINSLGDKKPPRLAMTWGKMAGRAADVTMPQTATMKVDAYTFKAQPLILHIHLLSRVVALPFAPAAVPDDGHLVLIYDRDGTRDVVSHYIRDLRKNRYQYVDGIQMIRGQRVTIMPASGRVWLMDGDKIEFAGEAIAIEILHRIVRVFSDVPSVEK